MSNKRLRELADMHGQCSLATRAWAADEIQRLTALVESCSARNAADADRIAKLEAFEKSRRKYRNALRELETDDE